MFCRAYFLTLIPCFFMLALTMWAMVANELNFYRKGNWLLAIVNVLTLLLAVGLIVEALRVLFRPHRPDPDAA